MPQTHSRVQEAFQELAEATKGSFQFANVKQYISAILEDFKQRAWDRELPGYKRSIAAFTRVLHTFWKEAEAIILNPFFQDSKISEILEETQNFLPGLHTGFLEQYISDEEIRKLYTTKLPVDFLKLIDLEWVRLEFVKQWVLRALGEDTWSEVRRAFLLQAMYYTWYGYDKNIS